MILNKYMFREYDIRGKLGPDQLTDEGIRAIGQGFGTYLLRKKIKTCIIGFDYRSYSEAVKLRMQEGLLKSGIKVIDLGLCLVPMVYYAQYHLKSKGAVMITASHNPDGWTGFKMGSGYSKTLKSDDLQELYQLIAKDDFINGKGKLVKFNIIPYYVKRVSKIKLKKPMKIVLDCGNGTAGAFAPKIFRQAGIKVIEQYCNLDWTFPNHNPNPELLDGRNEVAALVKKHKADIGVLLDGDGDRLGIVDDKGNNIWADKIMILLSRQILLKKKKAKIIFDVKCSEALPEDIKAHGGVPIMWKTGHSWIKSALHEKKGALAGERSGHIFFVDGYYGYDDATYAALRLIEYLSSIKNTMSQELETTPQYVISPTIHVDCADDKKYAIVDKLISDFKKTGNRLIDINGARVYFEDGWGLVRASSNEPVLVLVFEAKTKEGLDKIKANFKKMLSKYPDIGSKWHNE